jgi:hypothetical protein
MRRQERRQVQGNPLPAIPEPSPQGDHYARPEEKGREEDYVVRNSRYERAA